LVSAGVKLAESLVSLMIDGIEFSLDIVFEWKDALTKSV
jgi:hypothetical protein